MGRMLDALNRSEPKPPPISPPAPPPPVSEAIPVVDAVECPAEATEEPAEEREAEANVPFIEVGGSRSAIDASPDVLAAPSPRRALVEPVNKPAAEEETMSVGMVSIWCSWTLRPGVKEI